MRKALILLIPVLAVTLTGCAPNTDVAYKNCYESWVSLVRLDDTLTLEEATVKFLQVAELCTNEAKEDPEGFNEKWGD